MDRFSPAELAVVERFLSSPPPPPADEQCASRSVRALTDAFNNHRVPAPIRPAGPVEQARWPGGMWVRGYGPAS